MCKTEVLGILHPPLRNVHVIFLSSVPLGCASICPFQYSPPTHFRKVTFLCLHVLVALWKGLSTRKASLQRFRCTWTGTSRTPFTGRCCQAPSATAAASTAAARRLRRGSSVVDIGSAGMGSSRRGSMGIVGGRGRGGGGDAHISPGIGIKHFNTVSKGK